MAAQSFLFFIAGFETSSTILSFTILELSRNLELQDRLQQEVDKMYITYDGEITYDSLSHLVYMDKVIAGRLIFLLIVPYFNQNGGNHQGFISS